MSCFRSAFPLSVNALWSVSMMIKLLLSESITNFRGVYFNGWEIWLKTAPSFSRAKILQGKKTRVRQCHSVVSQVRKEGGGGVTNMSPILKPSPRGKP